MKKNRQWSLLFLAVFAVSAILACTSGMKHISFSITDEDLAIMDAYGDTASLLDNIERSLDRSLRMEKKEQVLRLSHHIYGSTPGDRRAALALTRSAYLVADVASSDEKQVAAARIGVAAAQAAGALVDSPEASYYFALNLGLVMRQQGLAALAKLDDLKQALDQCQSQTGLDYGGPQRVLGMLYLKAPPWPQGMGDIDAALELLQTAVQAYPRFPQNHIFYAEALFSEGMLEEAKHQLISAAGDLNPEKWGPDYILIWQNQINVLMEQIEQ